MPQRPRRMDRGAARVWGGEMATDRMSAKERFLAGIHGEPTDRAPVASPTSVAHRGADGAHRGLVSGGASGRRADGAAGGRRPRDPGLTMPSCPSSVWCRRPRHWAARWTGGPADTMPAACTHPWQEPEQVQGPADFLERPPIGRLWTRSGILRRTHGGPRRHRRQGHGPWTLSYHLHGIQDFLADTLPRSRQGARVPRSAQGG